jgi:hypothetical protein
MNTTAKRIVHTVTVFKKMDYKGVELSPFYSLVVDDWDFTDSRTSRLLAIKSALDFISNISSEVNFEMVLEILGNDSHSDTGRNYLAIQCEGKGDYIKGVLESELDIVQGTNHTAATNQPDSKKKSQTKSSVKSPSTKAKASENLFGFARAR